MDAIEGRGPMSRRETAAPRPGARVAAGPRRQAGTGEEAARLPDPFGDIAAPPLRVTPPTDAADRGPWSGPPRGVAPELLRLERDRDPPGVIVLRRPIDFARVGANSRAAPAPAAAQREEPGEDIADLADPPSEAEFGVSADVSRWDAPRESCFSPDLGPPAAPAPPGEAVHPGRRQLRWAVAFGLVLAVGIVALAIVFRPIAAETAATPIPTTIDAAPIPAPRLHADSSVATRPGAADVRLRFGPGLDAARQDALRTAVAEAGYGSVDLHPMPFAIERARIEYFHDADRGAAETLARTLASLSAEPIDLRDLSLTKSAAGAGRIDVWLKE